MERLLEVLKENMYTADNRFVYEYVAWRKINYHNIFLFVCCCLFVLLMSGYFLHLHTVRIYERFTKKQKDENMRRHEQAEIRLIRFMFFFWFLIFFFFRSSFKN